MSAATNNLDQAGFGFTEGESPKVDGHANLIIMRPSARYGVEFSGFHETFLHIDHFMIQGGYDGTFWSRVRACRLVWKWLKGAK